MDTAGGVGRRYDGVGPFGALDSLCGTGGRHARRALGNIPVRFPVQPPAEDRGGHIDLNTPLSADHWAVCGRPHTLLLLTLLSEVSSDDAPTRIRVGSHRKIAAGLGTEPVEFAESGPPAGVWANAGDG